MVKRNARINRVGVDFARYDRRIFIAMKSNLLSAACDCNIQTINPSAGARYFVSQIIILREKDASSFCYGIIRCKRERICCDTIDHTVDEV